MRLYLAVAGKNQSRWLHCLVCVYAHYELRQGIGFSLSMRFSLSANVLEIQWPGFLNSRGLTINIKYPFMSGYEAIAKRFFGCKLPVQCSDEPTDYCSLLIMRNWLETW